jgi:hypothetical protein
MGTKQFTQHQKILGLMIARKDKQEWFFAYDFMPPRLSLDYVYCVGYEATARFAELAGKYPEMIESQNAGKYKKRRILWDDMAKWLPLLPKDLRYMFHRTGTTKDIRTATEPTKISEPATPAEPKRAVRYHALYKGRHDSEHQPVKGQQYEIAVGKLQMGQPVIIDCPLDTKIPPTIYHQEYKDVASFQAQWQIVSGAL